jgi:urease accessory protein
MTHLQKIAIALAASLVATPALAHVGQGDHGGFVHGFLHPIGGLDHVLAMIGVGLLAVQLGGRALWLVPVSFVAMMVAGGLVGFAGVELPYVETAIALSVVVIGLLVALDLGIPIAIAMALAGLFAVFHGHAHGTELPEGSAPLAYAAGFVLATALLHLAGIGAGVLLGRLAEGARAWMPRVLGGGMTLAGAALLAQTVYG